MPSAERHWARCLGRRRRGSPESEDLPVALHTDPLAEGGIVAKRLVLVLLFFVRPAAAAAAATVKVRVEGKTKTLFAPSEVTVTASNALDALEQASLLGEFYYHVTPAELRSVHRPGRPLRRHRIERLGLQGRRQVAAGRRRQGAARRRRSRALVLRRLRADGRSADARREGGRQGLLHGARVRRQRRHGDRHGPRSCTSAPSGRSKRPPTATSVPARTRACSCARPRPARSARTR